MAEHRIGRDVKTHTRWDVDNEPVLVVQPGDTVTAETDDFSGSQITRTSVAADLLAVDFATIYPLAGPIAVEGARAGRHAVGRDPRLRAARLGLRLHHPRLRAAAARGSSASP